MDAIPFTASAYHGLLNEEKLMGTRCTACAGLYLPPRAICPACHSDRMEWQALSGRGHLAAFTVIAIGPSWMNAQGFGRDNPYISGIVELEEGVKISARILGLDAKDPAGIRIGTPLQVEFIECEGRAKLLAFRVQEGA